MIRVVFTTLLLLLPTAHVALAGPDDKPEETYEELRARIKIRDDARHAKQAAFLTNVTPATRTSPRTSADQIFYAKRGWEYDWQRLADRPDILAASAAGQSFMMDYVRRIEEPLGPPDSQVVATSFNGAWQAFQLSLTQTRRTRPLDHATAARFARDTLAPRYTRTEIEHSDPDYVRELASLTLQNEIFMERPRKLRPYEIAEQTKIWLTQQKSDLIRQSELLGMEQVKAFGALLGPQAKLVGHAPDDFPPVLLSEALKTGRIYYSDAAMRPMLRMTDGSSKPIESLSNGKNVIPVYEPVAGKALATTRELLGGKRGVLDPVVDQKLAVFFYRAYQMHNRGATAQKSGRLFRILSLRPTEQAKLLGDPVKMQKWIADTCAAIAPQKPSWTQYVALAVGGDELSLEFRLGLSSYEDNKVLAGLVANGFKQGLDFWRKQDLATSGRPYVDEKMDPSQRTQDGQVDSHFGRSDRIPTNDSREEVGQKSRLTHFLVRDLQPHSQTDSVHFDVPDYDDFAKETNGQAHNVILSPHDRAQCELKSVRGAVAVSGRLAIPQPRGQSLVRMELWDADGHLLHEGKDYRIWTIPGSSRTWLELTARNQDRWDGQFHFTARFGPRLPPRARSGAADVLVPAPRLRAILKQLQEAGFTHLSQELEQALAHQTDGLSLARLEAIFVSSGQYTYDREGPEIEVPLTTDQAVNPFRFFTRFLKKMAASMRNATAPTACLPPS